MAYPQNFVSQNGPAISAAWLNGIDTLANSPAALDGAQNVSEILTALGLSVPTQQSIGELIWPETTAESVSGAIPVQFFYPPGNVLRYGANANPGTTDMTAAIQAAINQGTQPGGVTAYIPAGTYLVAGQLVGATDVSLRGDGASTILQFSSTAGNDYITAAGVMNFSVSYMQLQVTTPTTGSGYTGMIGIRANSSYCRVENVFISSFNNQGILLSASSNCRIVGNTIVGFEGTYTDAADIHCFTDDISNLAFNIIEDNQCFGGGAHGIALETSSTPNTLMWKNLIKGNRVGTHAAYGILLYCHVTSVTDTYNQVVDNYVEGITGLSVPQGGAAGAGIYVAGMTATSILGNTVVNCCTGTSAAGLAPGGIGFNGPAAGGPSTIVGNSVYDMAQGNTNAVTIAGICLIGLAAGSTVAGNTLSQQVATSVVYAGIYLAPGNLGGGNNLAITGNNISILNTIASTRGIMAFANGTGEISGLSITGNIVNGCNYGGISLEQLSSSYTVDNVTIAGNTIFGGGSSNIGIRLQATGSSVVALSGNNVTTEAGLALYISGTEYVQVTGGMLNSSGAFAVQTTGTCSGGSMSESTILLAGSISGNAAANNSGTGFNLRQLGSAAPTGGSTAQAGDVMINPAGTNPAFWLNTTTGSPGAWVPQATQQTVPTGFGTPTGAGVVANFPGATATLAQCSEAIAEILTIMKAIGQVAT
jgi:hypothetical protein